MAKEDKFAFAVCTVVFIGAVIGGMMATWDAGREYGKREAIKKLMGKYHER